MIMHTTYREQLRATEAVQSTQLISILFSLAGLDISISVLTPTY